MTRFSMKHRSVPFYYCSLTMSMIMMVVIQYNLYSILILPSLVSEVQAFVYPHIYSEKKNNRKNNSKNYNTNHPRTFHKRPITLKPTTSTIEFGFGCNLLPDNNNIRFNSVMNSQGTGIDSTIDSSEYARQELARKQAEYEASLRAKTRAQAAKSTDPIPSLYDLPLYPYLSPESGLITPVVTTKSTRASVYAIYDATQELRYVGISRNVGQSLRLHLARMPEYTYFYRVHHITKPSKAVLELTKEAWILEGGPHVDGNKNDAVQEMWEKPFDIMPILTEEDKALIVATKDRGRPEESAIKKIARRHEAVKVEILEGRGCTENLRFDPKLKGKGLLDFYIERPKDEVPTTDLEKQKAAGANA